MANFHGKVKNKKDWEEEEAKINYRHYGPFSPETEFNLLVNGNRYFVSKNEHFFKTCPVLFSSIFIYLFVCSFYKTVKTANILAS